MKILVQIIQSERHKTPKLPVILDENSFVYDNIKYVFPDFVRYHIEDIPFVSSAERENPESKEDMGDICVTLIHYVNLRDYQNFVSISFDDLLFTEAETNPQSIPPFDYVHIVKPYFKTNREICAEKEGEILSLEEEIQSLSSKMQFYQAELLMNPENEESKREFRRIFDDIKNKNQSLLKLKEEFEILKGQDNS